MTPAVKRSRAAAGREVDTCAPRSLFFRITEIVVMRTESR